MIDNFCDKNLVISTFFCDYHGAAAHVCAKTKKLDNIYTGLSFLVNAW